MEQSRQGIERVLDRYDDHPLRRVEAKLREAHSDILTWPLPPTWEGLLEQLNVPSHSEGDLHWS